MVLLVHLVQLLLLDLTVVLVIQSSLVQLLLVDEKTGLMVVLFVLVLNAVLDLVVHQNLIPWSLWVLRAVLMIQVHLDLV